MHHTTNVVWSERPPARIIAAMRSLAGILLIASAALASIAAASGARTAASSFQLVFDGRHNADLLHEGTFTTSASFCPSGRAVDVTVDSGTDSATRRFTCGSGDFTARVTPLPAEHGGGGSWQIVAGTGPLADLRGRGTWTSVRLGGSSADPATITFRSTWHGIADFDVSPPTVAVAKAAARKLRRPKGSYSLRLVLALVDPEGNPVAYRLRVIDPHRPVDPLVSKAGETSAAAVTFVVRVHPTARTRALQVRLDASDPVGNASAAARTLRLR
jgi:hypothetical protein